MFFRRVACATVLAAQPLCAWAAEDAPSPKREQSPFTDQDGVYDRQSQCWVWDHGSGGPQSGGQFEFATFARCDGKPIEGKAVLRWQNGRRQGETWEGEFRNGRFSGRATARYTDSEFEGSYVDGMRNGPAVFKFRDGGRRDLTFAYDRLQGRSANIYAEGSRTDEIFDRGEAVGTWILTYADGSQVEVSLLPGHSPGSLSGTYIAPDGKRMPGLYTPPRVDRAQNPPLEYPQEAWRRNEQGSVTIRVTVSSEGAVLDAKLARTSGSALLDQSAMEQTAKWRFIPATLNGKPMTAMVVFNQTFQTR